MRQLPEEYVKGLEFMFLLAYNKGKQDSESGKQSEPNESFFQSRVREIEKLVCTNLG